MLFAGSVAVAVTNCPAPGTAGKVRLKLALPLASVVTRATSRSVRPWPNPEGSAAGLPKNSRRNAVRGVLFNVPCTVVLPPAVVAVLSTG